jgi:hypothetical protein
MIDAPWCITGRSVTAGVIGPAVPVEYKKVEMQDACQADGGVVFSVVQDSILHDHQETRGY